MIQEKSKHRIAKIFTEHSDDSKIMSLFLTAGYPDLASTVDLILGLDENGTDLIELGMPFSDPLADGPTIQHSSNKAIENGITMSRIFEMVKEVRKHSDIPIILMGYVNPVLRYGIEAFCEEAAKSGVDGLIIPDLPVEESHVMEKSTKEYDLPLMYLVAPNTTDERMKL